MFLRDNEICNICGESIEMISDDIQRCPNCRARLLNRNHNFISNRNHLSLINNNIFTGINSNRSDRKDNIFPKNEELKEIEMTLNLYNKKNDKLEPPDCCICLDEILYGQFIYLLSCNHLFHTECAYKWFKKKSECPYCRKQFNFIYK